MIKIVRRMNKITVQIVLVILYFPVLAISKIIYKITERKKDTDKSYWITETLPKEKKYFESAY